MATSLAAAGAAPIEVKPDPEIDLKPSVSQLTSANAPIRVKYENPDSDDNGIDNAIPIASDSDDMFDDVDEEEDDEDGDLEDEIVDLTYEGLVHIQGVEHFVCRAFKIRQIPQPEVRMIDLGSLFGCLEYGSIVLNPDYQREAVWDEHRASTLINSISMGYFVPPIIFNRKLVITETPEGKVSQQKKICVDGKQRLTSLFKFMSGQIGIWDSNNPQKKWYFCHPKVDGEEVASNHNIMPQAVKDFFRQRRLCCYEYEELSQDIEENMFQLVQRGIALTPAEKMRAMSTEWAAFAKQYEEDYSIIVNLSKQNRASGFRSVLTIFAMIQEVMAERRAKPLYPALQASPQALNKLLEDKEPINPALKLKFKAIFDKIENLVKLSSTQLTATKYKLNKNSVFDPAPDFLREDNVSHVRTFSPLELIGTAVLVSYHMENRSDEELLNDVKKLRRHLRLTHKDLRVNAQCWNTVWDFIDKLGTDAEGTDPVSITATKKKKRRAPARGAKGKAKAKPQSKKRKKPVRKPARPPPRARRRATNSVTESPSSSELSSAPSSDESDDEDFMSGLLSPLFPSLMPNRVASRDSSIQAQTPASTTGNNIEVPRASSPKISHGGSDIEDAEDADSEAPFVPNGRTRIRLPSRPSSPKTPNSADTGIVRDHISSRVESQSTSQSKSLRTKLPSKPDLPKIANVTAITEGLQPGTTSRVESQPSKDEEPFSATLQKKSNDILDLEDLSRDVDMPDTPTVPKELPKVSRESDELRISGESNDEQTRQKPEHIRESTIPKASRDPESRTESKVSKLHKESELRKESQIPMIHKEPELGEKTEVPQILKVHKKPEPAKDSEVHKISKVSKGAEAIKHLPATKNVSTDIRTSKALPAAAEKVPNSIRIQSSPEPTLQAGNDSNTSVAEPSPIIEIKSIPTKDPPNIVRPDRTGIPDKPKSRFKPKAPNREERKLQLNKVLEPSFPNGTPPTGPKNDRPRKEISGSKHLLNNGIRKAETSIPSSHEGSSDSQNAWPNGPPPTGPSMKRPREGSSGSLPPFSKRSKESAV